MSGKVRCCHYERAIVRVPRDLSSEAKEKQFYSIFVLHSFQRDVLNDTRGGSSKKKKEKEEKKEIQGKSKGDKTN